MSAATLKQRGYFVELRVLNKDGMSDWPGRDAIFIYGRQIPNGSWRMIDVHDWQLK